MRVLHVKKAFRTLGIFGFAIAISGCSGSNGVFVGPATQTSVPTTASTQVNVPASGVRQTLPTIAGITPTIEVPGGDVTQPFTLTVAESTAAPAGFPALNGATPSLYITIAKHGGPAQLPVAPILTFALASGTSNNTLTAFFVPDGTTGAFARRVAIVRRADSTAQSTLIQNAQSIGGGFAYEFPFGDYSGTIALAPSQSNPQPGCALAVGLTAVSLCAGPFSANGTSFSGPIVTGFAGSVPTYAQGSAANQGCAPSFQPSSIPVTRVSSPDGYQIESAVSGSFNINGYAYCDAAISDGRSWYTFNVDVVRSGGGAVGPLGVRYFTGDSAYLYDPNYAGPILYSPSLSTCPAADVSVTAQVLGSSPPTSDRGPTAIFVISNVSNTLGSCTIAFVDALLGVATITINPGATPIPSASPSATASPSAGTLVASSSPFIVRSLAITNLTISETGYTGPILIDPATTCALGAASNEDFSIAPSSGSGPSQIFAFNQASGNPPHFTPSPSGPFNYCNMIFDDDHGGQLTVQTTVEP